MLRAGLKRPLGPCAPARRASSTAARSYASALRDIYATNDRFPAVKQGLSNVLELDRALGSPSQRLKVIHVTGSNGKGSVCWKLHRALMAQGLRAGLFISPHISCFRERIRVGDELIGEAEVVALLAEVRAAAEQRRVPATFFEVVTAMAFAHFARSQVDCVVLEVGLGGRLDSTNIVPRNALAVVTNISLEHTKILGETREQIAWEKAHIAKPGCPMLIGPRVPREPVAQVCAAVGAPLTVLPPLPPLARGAWRDYDEENVATVRAALGMLGLEDSSAAARAALAARPPCRFEVVVAPQPGRPSLHVLDVAHNHDALDRLFEALRARAAELRERLGAAPGLPLRAQLVLALSSDKDHERCVASVRRNADLVGRLLLTKARTSRAQEPERMLAAFNASPEPLAAPIDEARAYEDVTAALADADAHRGRYPVTLVSGTFFMMTEARKFLGLEHPVDPDGVLHKAPVAPLEHARAGSST
jgi:dihydrofolate synthase/folylpolyglutamate synthase